jgi:hypothetical protein
MSDFEFLSVEFTYEGVNYFSLIRKKKKTNCFEYHITIMNGKLEKLLYGNHIVKQINGVLESGCLSSDSKLINLKHCVTSALQQYLSSQRPMEAAATEGAQ